MPPFCTPSPPYVVILNLELAKASLLLFLFSSSSSSSSLLLFVSGRLDVTTVNLARTLFNTLAKATGKNFARAYLDCGAVIKEDTQKEREPKEAAQQKVS